MANAEKIKIDFKKIQGDYNEQLVLSEKALVDVIRILLPLDFDSRSRVVNGILGFFNMIDWKEK